MSTLHTRRDPSSSSARHSLAIRVGHFYFDIQQQLLHCLNEVAKQLVVQGIPFHTEQLGQHQGRNGSNTRIGATFTSLTGELLLEKDLPLVRTVRERRAQEATHVWTHPDGRVEYLHWHAVPFGETGSNVGPAGKMIGVMLTLVLSPPEPDWEQLAGLAHDLRSSLQIMQFVAPSLKAPASDTSTSFAFRGQLQTAIGRCLAIASDLLGWCRSPIQGGRRVSSQPIPLVPFLRSLVAEQEMLAHSRNIPLHLDLSAVEGLQVHTDRIRLGRLVTNLLSNAIRYTTTGGVQLTACWRLDDAYQKEVLLIRVLDTGPGLSAEEQESIFQPFERGKAGRESDSGGSGVGLMVVDQLTRELGLVLEVSSEPGRGSTFDLVLPASLLDRRDDPQKPGAPH